MVKRSIMLILSVLLAWQSVMSVADVHQTHQSGMQHFVFDQNYRHIKHHADLSSQWLKSQWLKPQWYTPQGFSSQSFPFQELSLQKSATQGSVVENENSTVQIFKENIAYEKMRQVGEQNDCHHCCHCHRIATVALIVQHQTISLTKHPALFSAI